MAEDVITCPRCAQRNRLPAAGTGKPRCAKCQTWLPWIIDADDRDYDAVVPASPVPVLVSSSSCGAGTGAIQREGRRFRC